MPSTPLINITKNIGLFFRSIAQRSTGRRIAAEPLRDSSKEFREASYELTRRALVHISHEFRTLLTLIQGPCDRILSHGNCDPFVLRHAGLIRRNAERMNDLIGSLMEHSHTGTGNRTPHIEPLDVSELAAAVFDDFSDSAASRGLTYTCDIAPEVMWNSDRNFLTAIIINLIAGALESAERKGKISVAVSAVGMYLQITVSYTGKNVRPEEIESLSVAHDLAQLLGGRIEVGEENDSATRFTVFLPETEAVPATENAENHTHTAADPAPAYMFDERNPSMMLIDGTHDMICFLSEIFAAEYNVIPVDSPDKITPLMEEITPSAIICDMMMPGIDGITLARNLRADPRSAHIPLIFLSAKHCIEEQIAGLEAGADLYIAKPFNTEYLKIYVRRLISRGEILKEYFASPQSAWELTGGRMMHVDHRRFIQQVLDVITDNLRERHLSVQFIADKMNMSPRHLYRKLQEMGAQSPSQMIRESRLHVAVDLLQNTTMTVDEIIYKSGFSNRGPFFNAFSEKFGCTPREYRERRIKGIL